MLRPAEKQGSRSSWTKRPWRPAMAVIGFAACLGGCTFLLDFDEPLEPGASDAAIEFDAPNIPDADTSADAATAANCEEFEPNDTLETPIAINPGTLAAAICPDADGDFYSFALLGNTNLTITLSFDNSSSDLNLRLYNAADDVVAAAVGTDATEQIVRGPAQTNELPAGTYRIEVFSATGDSTVDYDLTLNLVVGA